MQSSHPLMSRQLSSDSVSSVTSQATNLSSVSSISPNQPPGSCSPSPSPSLKKKSWLRNSFSKAFSRSKRPQGGSRQGTGSDSEESSGPVRGNGSTWSAPSSPMLASHHPHHHTDMADDVDRSIAIPETVQDLKKQLREKEMVLTDIRLEALSSAHQLEALKETVSRMRVRSNSITISHWYSLHYFHYFYIFFRTKCLHSSKIMNDSSAKWSTIQQSLRPITQLTVVLLIVDRQLMRPQLLLVSD